MSGRFRLFIAGGLALSLSSLRAQPGVAQVSIVPPAEEISAVAARLTYARALANNETTRSDAAAAYERLLADDPGNEFGEVELADVLCQLGRVEDARTRLRAARLAQPENPLIAAAQARIEFWGGRPDEARRLAQAAAALLRAKAERAPANADIRILWAELEAQLGHAELSQRLYLEGFQLKTPSLDDRIRQARSQIMGGDAYAAENSLREILRRNPGNPTARAELAALLVRFDRTKDAEPIYGRWLLENPTDRAALSGMARLRLAESRYADAVKWTDRILANDPHDLEALSLRAEALTAAHHDDEARAAWQSLADLPARRAYGLLGLGQIDLRQNRLDAAHRHFAQAAEFDPSDPLIEFRAADPRQIHSGAAVTRLIEQSRDAAAAPRLTSWADALARAGEPREAIRCLQAAHAVDPEYYPAALQLAEQLAIEGEFDAALPAFEQLRTRFPQNRQVLIGRARALGWSHHYPESVAAYGEILRLNPSDAIARRELARVFGWAKQRDESAKAYAAVWASPVDTRLRERLGELLPQLASTPAVTQWRALVAEAPDPSGEPFALFARFDREHEALSEGQPAAQQDSLARLRLDLLGDFRVQQSFYLENEAKALSWNRRFAGAEAAYARLIGLEPGNQEARFDVSQVQAAQNLGGRERASLVQLLELDPGNTLAGPALHRRDRRSAGQLEGMARFWQENGRGGLSGIHRAEVSAGGEVTARDQYQIQASVHDYREKPAGTSSAFYATGVSVAAQGVVDEWLSGSVQLAHRRFDDSRLGDRDSGQAQVWINAQDYARVGAGWEKREELYNRFGLYDDVSSDAWWIGAEAVLNRRWEADARFSFVDYSDGNQARWFVLRPAYTWTDHPRTFKTMLTLEYRDTDRASVYSYAGPALTNIVHPYWTPQNYVREALTLEWRRDLSREFFVGAPENFFDTRLTFATDTQHNPGATLEAEWHREWRDRWILRAAVYVSRSREWNATGANLNLARRF